MLKIRNLDAGYGSLSVLRRVSIHVKQGEIVTIIGANGAGKTTLLKTVTGLLKAQAGEIIFDGKDLHGVPTEQVVLRGCSLVPEGRQVFPAMPVKENLLLGGYVQFKRGNKSDVERGLDHVFRLFPVLKQRERQLAGTLSGGEQQMLAIGRALMARPRLMLLDEPSLGLAPLLVKEIFEIVQKICTEEKTTVLLVEQNANLALSIGHYGYVMEMGKVVLDGECARLRENEDVKEFYLGLSEVGKKKSFKDAKHYRRRKRWLS
jgi:branched-chain amino acid transport system ATP-binding protein